MAIEVLDRIADQHDVVGEEADDPVEVVCGLSLLELDQNATSAALGIPGHGQ